MKKLAALLAAVAIASCAISKPALADKDSDTLRIGWGANGVMVTADNYYGATRTGIWFSVLVWDTLVHRDPETGEYQPLLATAWKWIDDKTLEFTLRHGVKFHDGSPFSADDVVYTLNWISNPANGVKFQRVVNWIERAEKLDEFTVRVHTKTIFPQALEYLSGPIPIYPASYYAKVGADGMAKRPIGTGPYRVVEMQQGVRYVLARNETYDWGSPKSKAKIKTIVIRELPDVQTQLTELVAGGLDFSPDISTDLATRLKSVPRLRTELAETMRIGYLLFDAVGRAGNSPVQNLKVRQAIAHAIDRRSIVENLVKGNARVLDTPCYPTQFGCDPNAVETHAYDPGKAKQLLADAGYPNGFDIELIAEQSSPGGEAVVANLAAVGIRAKLTALPYEAYRERLLDNKASFVLTNWGSYSLNDASAVMSVFFNGSEDDFARDDRLRSTLQAADGSVDPAVRKAKYAEAERIITSQVYWAPLHTYVRSYAFTANLVFRAFADEIPRFYDYSWK
ncbi:MAG: ABC transporter substrate-binding protein [Hyphomicrobiales bacterium]